MRHLLAVAAALGCSSKKPDPACVGSTDRLKAWIADLVADGTRMVDTEGMSLVKLDRQGPMSLASVPAVYMSPKGVSFGGELLPMTDNGNSLRAAMAEAPKSTDVLFVIDAAVPWSDVVTAVNAGAAEGRTHVMFAFVAGASGKAAPPPPSAVDKELDELAKPPDPSEPAPKLYRSDDPDRPPTIPDKVFKDCPTTKDAMSRIGNAETTQDKDKALIEGLPAAIAACGCKVEIASVQRLMWSWFNRDRMPPLTSVTVDVDPKGTAVTAKGPWSDASKAIVDVAKAGKPITLK